MGWSAIFRAALLRREGFPYAHCCRLLMGRKAGRGDLLHAPPDRHPKEGVTVDRFGQALLVTAYEEGVDPLLFFHNAPKGVVSCYFQPRYLPGRHAPLLVAGEPLGAFTVEEGGLRYGVDLERGMNPGVFLDTRPLRQLLMSGRFAGKRVLNLFSYTCTMGAAALLGGARGVTNVDSSGSALKRGMENYRRNRLAPAPRDFVKSEVFKKLRWYAKRDTHFDLILCDPPPVLPGRGKGLELYRELWSRLLPLVAPKGLVLLVSRDVEVSMERLYGALGIKGESLGPHQDLHPLPEDEPSRFKAALVQV